MQHEQSEPLPSPTLPTDRRALLAGIGGLAAGAFLASTANAGPLDPPAGPIESTGKTLRDVEPRIAINSTNTPGDTDSVFKITQPGSYYLTGNVTGVAGKHGIKITTSNGVTLDLCGFDMLGVAGSLSGITGTGIYGLITIQNGRIGGWGQRGINLPDSESYEVDRITATANGDGGIVVGANARVIRCLALLSLGESDGIAVGPGSLVESCSASNCGGKGIATGLNALVRGCHTSGNGREGILTEGQSAVIACTASTNGAAGIDAGYGSAVTSCSCCNNVGDGILCTTAAAISDCTARNNGRDGISASVGSTIQRCSASYNLRDGIRLFDPFVADTDGGVVTDCVTTRNSQHGIHVRGGVSVRNNQCSRNGEGNTSYAGIRITGTACIITGNNCNLNGTGIRAMGTGNFFERNVCSSNAQNWSIVANNKCLVVNGVNAAAITGDSGGTSPGSTNPYANYTY